MQPAASAGAIFHAAIASGKFHGMIWPTTPTGSRRVYALNCTPGGPADTSRVEPSILVAQPAMYRKYSRVPGMSMMLVMNRVLPLSRLSSSQSSSKLASIRSDSFHNRSCRNEGLAPAHSGDWSAARAAFTARSTSFAFASGTLAIWRSLAGSMTGISSRDAESTHSPPMNSFFGRPRKPPTISDGSGCCAIAVLMVIPLFVKLARVSLSKSRGWSRAETRSRHSSDKRP